MEIAEIADRPAVVEIAALAVAIALGAAGTPGAAGAGAGAVAVAVDSVLRVVCCWEGKRQESTGCGLGVAGAGSEEEVSS